MHLCLCGILLKSQSSIKTSLRPPTLVCVHRTEPVIVCKCTAPCCSPLLRHSLILQSLQYLNNPFQITHPISLIARNSVYCQYFPPCWLTVSNYSSITSHRLFLLLWFPAFLDHLSCYILRWFQQMYFFLQVAINKTKKTTTFPMVSTSVGINHLDE